MSGSVTISNLPAASSLNLVDKFPVDQVISGSIVTNYGTMAQILSLATPYSLPQATTSTLGGIIVGSNLSVSSGVLSANASPYQLPTATTSTLGGIIVGTNLTISNGILSASGGNALATTGAPGIVQIGAGVNISGGVI